MDYKICTIRQGAQVLVDQNEREVAYISNSRDGWIAQRYDGTRWERRPLNPVGEPVNVTHIINQADGAALIARAMGLA